MQFQKSGSQVAYFQQNIQHEQGEPQKGHFPLANR